MAYQSWSVVFGEQPSASKWNILGTNDAYFDSLIGSGTAWTTWSPTWTNLTVDNGVQSAFYQQFGKTVSFRLSLVFGSGTSIGGTVTIAPPVTAATYNTNVPIGNFLMNDASGSSTFGLLRLASTTSITFSRFITESGSNPVQVVPAGTAFNATNPWAWTTNDVVAFTGTYEAA